MIEFRNLKTGRFDLSLDMAANVAYYVYNRGTGGTALVHTHTQRHFLISIKTSSSFLVAIGVHELLKAINDYPSRGPSPH